MLPPPDIQVSSHIDDAFDSSPFAVSKRILLVNFVRTCDLQDYLAHSCPSQPKPGALSRKRLNLGQTMKSVSFNGSSPTSGESAPFAIESPRNKSSPQNCHRPIGAVLVLRRKARAFSFCARAFFLSAIAAGGSALVAPSAQAAPPYLQVVAKLQERPGNPAVTPDGRILFSQQPLDPHEFKVLELKKDGTVVPFPNREWSAKRFAAVIGIRASSNGTVWILDMGGEGTEPKLVAWDTKTDQLIKEISIPDSARRPNSFLQDFALDQTRGFATITDMTMGNLAGESHPAFVVVNLSTGKVRRLLEDHPSFMPSGPAVAQGKTLAAKRPSGSVDEIAFGLNGVTIDPSDRWVFFGPVNGNALYRVPAAALADEELSPQELSSQISRYREKRTSDGISVDSAGNVYVSDVGASAIGVATAKGYRVLVRNEKLLSWPDGFAFGPDGWVYVTANQLHLHEAVNRGNSEGKSPYYIVRFRPLATGKLGR